MSDRERLQRLREARETGTVHANLLPYLIDLAGAAPEFCASSPFDRLALKVGEEIFRWMARRGASGRNLGVARRSLNRALNGENVTIAVVADIADALNCDAYVYFRPRGRGVSGTTSPVDRGVSGTGALRQR